MSQIQTIDTDGPVIDPARRFYVSCIDDTGRKHSFLLGPFTLHTEALSKVNLVRSICYDIDYKSPWYQFGTCSLPVEDSERVEGKLNNHPKVVEPIEPITPPPVDPFD